MVKYYCKALRKDILMPGIVFPEGYTFYYSSVKQNNTVMHSNHYHSEIEIYYMISGRCNYFIDDKTYEVLPGDIVIIPENIIHKTNYDGEEHTRIVIECSRHFIPEAIFSEFSEKNYIYRNPNISHEISLMFKKIDAEYKRSDAFSPDIIRSYMHLLMFLLARNRNFAEKTESKNMVIEDVVLYIKKNFATDISLSSVAKLHFVSPEHLSRTFKRETGFGFNEYLTLVRLRHAERLLKAPEEMSISEIAYSSGFNDSNYFSDKFKRIYGQSPLKYRKENR